MSLLWRSWFAFVFLIGITLAALCYLAIVQHDIIYGRLVEQRLAVIAKTTGASFNSIVEIGLPLTMVRNGDDILARAQKLDPTATRIKVFDAQGIIVSSTEKDDQTKISEDIFHFFQKSEKISWSYKQENVLHSGYTIKDSENEVFGAIVVEYPEEEFLLKTSDIAHQIIKVATWLLVLGAVLAWLVLRIQLVDVLKSITRLGVLHSKLQRNEALTKPLEEEQLAVAEKGFFEQQIQFLENQLYSADQHFKQAKGSLKGLLGSIEIQKNSIKAPSNIVVAAQIGSPLARRVARFLIPWATTLVMGSTLLLGAFIYNNAEKSFLPELTARSELIGSVANNNIQVAISSGVPLSSLVGAESYFDELLQSFPEISYFGISSGSIVLEAGTRQHSLFSPQRPRKEVPTYPIISDGQQIGYIIVDTNPEYLALEFRKVLLDFAVIVLVVVLFSYHILIVAVSRSLTAPFVRLQHLVQRQAKGDFSNRITMFGKNEADKICQLLSRRSEELHQAFVSFLDSRCTGSDLARLKEIRSQFKLRNGKPNRLQFAYLNDIRLPLFLFTAADQLPLSFFPLYAATLENTFTWLDKGVVIGLPLMGYLVAIMLGSPIVRPLANRFGHRQLCLFAVIPTVLAHLAMSVADNITQLVLLRIVTGFSYAVVTLACQDYILDVVAKERRSNALSLFTSVLFGGLFIGTAIGGILADRLGQQPVFVFSAILVALFGLLTLKLLPRRAIKETDLEFHFKQCLTPIWQPLANFKFFALVVGIAIPANILMQVFISYLVTLQVIAIGGSIADTARILMLYFLIVSFIAPTIGRYSNRRFNQSYVALAGAVLSGLALLGPAFINSQWALLIGVVCAGVAHGMIRDSQVNLAMEIADTQLSYLGTTAVMASLRAIERIGSIIGLLSIAYYSSYAGLTSAISVVAGIVLFGALLFAFTVSKQASSSKFRWLKTTR